MKTTMINRKSNEAIAQALHNIQRLTGELPAVVCDERRRADRLGDDTFNIGRMRIELREIVRNAQAAMNVLDAIADAIGSERE